MRRGEHRLLRLSVLVTVLLLGLGVTAVLADSGSLDVEVPDKTGYANDQTDDGAIVEYIGDSNVTFGSAGSGIFEAFLRTHASPNETGYNSDLKKKDFEFDEVSGNFTHSILVSEIPVVECESVDGLVTVDDLCWELFADINDSNSTPLIQLTDLEIWFSDIPSPTGYDTSSDWNDKAYDFEGVVHINDVNQGSGRGDLRYLVPLEGITIPDDCDYGSSTCSTFFVLFTGWGDEEGGDYTTDAGFNEWKVKRYPFVSVTKTAVETYDRDFDWTIEKSVSPTTLDLFDGDSDDVTWTVTWTKSAPQDSNFAVNGTITIENTSDQDAIVGSVTDVLSVDGAATVNCPETLPFTLGEGATLVCTYSATTAAATDQTNTATVNLDNGGVHTGTADVDFGDPTNVTGDTADISDTNGATLPQDTSTSGSTSYQETFTCGADEGNHVNTATVTADDGQTDDDDATATVNCHDISVSKDALATYDRDFDWTITKSVSPTSLDLFNGESGDVTWTVTWTKGPAQDSNFAVNGTITVTNNHPSQTAENVAVSDVLSDATPVTLDCGDGPGDAVIDSIAAGVSAQCAYTAAPDDADDLTNTATATLFGIDYTHAPVDVDFGDPTNVTGDTADISDTNGATLPQDTSTSGSTSYQETFTCDADEGGHVNTATVTADDGQTDNDDATATVNCHGLSVSKDANTSLTRTYDWTLVKEVSIDGGGNWVDSASVEIGVGASQDYLWRLRATRLDGVDSNWAVNGTIMVTNNHPTAAAVNVVVSDVLSDATPVTLDCGDGAGDDTINSIAADGTATCSYSASPGDADTLTNTATATLLGVDYTSSDVTVDFATATVTEVDESATLSDPEVPSVDGDVITDSGTFVSGTNTFTCGETTTIVNTATLTEDDSGQEHVDDADLTVTCVGRVQITPTGTECEAFLADTATDLPTLEINPSDKLAPGAFIHFADIGVTGATTIEVSVESDNPADDPPTVNEAKIYAYDPGTGDCMQISNQPGVSVSIANNVATFELSAAAAAQYPNLVSYTKYSSGSGIEGTTYTFETRVNGSLVLTDTLVVVDNE